MEWILEIREKKQTKSKHFSPFWKEVLSLVELMACKLGQLVSVCNFPIQTLTSFSGKCFRKILLYYLPYRSEIFEDKNFEVILQYFKNLKNM